MTVSVVGLLLQSPRVPRTEWWRATPSMSLSLPVWWDVSSLAADPFQCRCLLPPQRWKQHGLLQELGTRRQLQGTEVWIIPSLWNIVYIAQPTTRLVLEPPKHLNHCNRRVGIKVLNMNKWFLVIWWLLTTLYVRIVVWRKVFSRV